MRSALISSDISSLTSTNLEIRYLLLFRHLFDEVVHVLRSTGLSEKLTTEADLTKNWYAYLKEKESERIVRHCMEGRYSLEITIANCRCSCSPEGL